jgi:hypothetical protein
MGNEYWQNSPFGEDSLFHPNWEDKKKIQPENENPPKIAFKCSSGIPKIKINCTVSIYFTLTDSSGFWDTDYNIKVSTKDTDLSIYDDNLDIQSGFTFQVPFSRSKAGRSTITITANQKYIFTFDFDFVDEKSVFTRSEKDKVVIENSLLINNDKVCFRVADKALDKLLNDNSLVLSSYSSLSGFTRMDEYEKKGYLHNRQKFNQATIWKRKTNKGYDLMPYDFQVGQSNCFSNFINNSMPCMGIHIYHYILLNGYHVLLLLVDNTNSCYPKFKILDQLKDREWDDFSNLDISLLNMTINNYNGACDASNRKDINSSINLCKIKRK